MRVSWTQAESGTLGGKEEQEARRNAERESERNA